MADPTKEQAAMPYRPAGEAHESAAADVKRRHEIELMEIEGVEGVGVGSRGGHETIVAYVRDEETAERLPREIEGVEVAAKVTGIVRGY